MNQDPSGGWRKAVWGTIGCFLSIAAVAVLIPIGYALWGIIFS